VEEFGLVLEKSGRHPGYDGNINGEKVQVKVHNSQERTNLSVGEPKEYAHLIILVGPRSRLRIGNNDESFYAYRFTSAEVKSTMASGNGYYCSKMTLLGMDYVSIDYSSEIPNNCETFAESVNRQGQPNVSSGSGPGTGRPPGNVTKGAGSGPPPVGRRPAADGQVRTLSPDKLEQPFSRVTPSNITSISVHGEQMSERGFRGPPAGPSRPSRESRDRNLRWPRCRSGRARGSWRRKDGMRRAAVGPRGFGR